MNEDSPNVLNMLDLMIVGRNEFLSSDLMRRVPFSRRADLISRYMSNEILYLEMMNRFHAEQTHLQNAAATLISLTMPNSTFLNPVTVVASRAQIESSLQNYQNTTSNCAICQDAISSGGCRIRQCGHVYHRSCIENWLTMSVRCPVCRHDIREEGQAIQTSFAAEQTSVQSSNQSEEPHTSE